jgi:hypothetical protein
MAATPFDLMNSSSQASCIDTVDRGRFQAELTTYCSGAIFSRQDLWLSFAFSWIPLRRHARRIYEGHRRVCGGLTGSRGVKKIRPADYSGANLHVQKMKTFMKRQLSGDLVAAYVHGSLATGEEIAYSDFDGLVILKDEVLDDLRRLAAVGRKLNASQAIMFQLDPFQHHGWFVISEAQLGAYPELYLPVEVLGTAASLFPDNGPELIVRPRYFPEEGRRDFLSFCRKLIQKLEPARKPRNLFALKSILSAFMLLPALYVRVRDGKGVLKKDSFDLAKPDFSADEWAVMDEASRMRADWHYRISPVKKWLMTRPHPFSRYLAKTLAPRIPSSLRSWLDKGFYSRMSRLVELMMTKTEQKPR